MPQRPCALNNRDGRPQASAVALVISALLIGVPGRALALDAILVVSPNNHSARSSTASAGQTPGQPEQSSLRLIAPGATPTVGPSNGGTSQPVAGSTSWTASDFQPPINQPPIKRDTLILVPKTTAQAGNDLMDALARVVCEPVNSDLPQSGEQLNGPDQLAASQAESLAKSLDMPAIVDPATTILLPTNSERSDDDSPSAGNSMIEKIARAFTDSTPSSSPAESQPQSPTTPTEALSDFSDLLARPEPVTIRDTSFVITPRPPNRAAEGAGDLMDQLAAMCAPGKSDSPPAPTSSRLTSTQTAANPVDEFHLAAPLALDSTTPAPDIGAPLIASSEASLAQAVPGLSSPPAEEPPVEFSEPPAPLAAVEPHDIAPLLGKLLESPPAPAEIASDRGDRSVLVERVERIVVPDPLPAKSEPSAEAIAAAEIGNELKVIAADPIAGESLTPSQSRSVESDRVAAANEVAPSMPREPAPIEGYYGTIATADAGRPAAAPFGTVDRHGWQPAPAPIQGLPTGLDPRQMVVVVVVPPGNGAPGTSFSLPMPVYDQNGRATFPYPVFGNAVTASPQSTDTISPAPAPIAADLATAEPDTAPSAALPKSTFQPTVLPTVDRYAATPDVTTNLADANGEPTALLAGSESPLKADGGWTVARPNISAPESTTLAQADSSAPSNDSDTEYGPTPADDDPPMRLALQPPAPAPARLAAEEATEGQLPEPPPSPPSGTPALAEPGALPGTPGGETDSIAKAEKLGEEPVNNQLQFLRSQTVLLEPGQWQWDVGLVYAHDQNDVPIALIDSMGDIAGVVDGQIRQREVFIPFAVRYGYSDRVQLFVDAPVGWAHTELSWLGSDEAESDGGIGDITAGAAFLVKSEDSRDVVFTFGLTAPTGDDPFGVSSIGLPTATLGDGFWAFSGELLFIQTYDPVVVFTSLGTRQFVQREFHGNEILPGGEYFWSLGVGLAVNSRVTLSTRFVAAYVAETTIDSDRVPGTVQEPMSIRMAATIAQKDYFVEPFVEFGTTNDAGSTAFGVVWTH